MSSAQSSQHFVAFATQSAWNTPETNADNFKYFASKAGGMKLARPSKASDQLRGMEPRWMHAQNQQADGSTPMDCYFEGWGLILKHAFTRVSSTQVAAFVVDATNNKIDFEEAPATPLVATLANGSYNSTTLATEVANKLTAAGSTFTCAYSPTTKKFTITQSGGTDYFTLLFATGVNVANSAASLLGFSAADVNTTAATTALTSDETSAAVYDHIFYLPDGGNFPDTYGLTIADHRDLETLVASSAFLTGISFAWGENDPHAPAITPSWLAAQLSLNGGEVSPEPLVPPAGVLLDIPGNPDGTFNFDITINGNPYSGQYVKSMTFNLTIPTALRHAIGSTVAKKCIRTGKAAGTLVFQWDYEDDNALKDDLLTIWKTRDEFATMSISQSGELIQGTTRQNWLLEFNAGRPIGDTPQAAQGTIEQPYNFQLQRDTTGQLPLVKITLTNAEYLA